MIISCGDQRLVGYARQCPTLAVGGVVFQGLHRNSYPGRLVFPLLRRWGGVVVVFQKVVQESPMGWCSRGWGGFPGGCPGILDGVVIQKLGWCSGGLSQNPNTVYYSVPCRFRISVCLLNLDQRKGKERRPKAIKHFVHGPCFQ